MARSRGEGILLELDVSRAALSVFHSAEDGFSERGYFQAPLDAEAFQNTDLLRLALRALADKAQGTITEPKEIIVVAPAHAVLLKSLQVPAVDAVTRAAILKHEVERHIPIEASEAIYAFYPSENVAASTTVVIAVVRRSMAEVICEAVADVFGPPSRLTVPVFSFPEKQDAEVQGAGILIFRHSTRITLIYQRGPEMRVQQLGWSSENDLPDFSPAACERLTRELEQFILRENLSREKLGLFAAEISEDTLKKLGETAGIPCVKLASPSVRAAVASQATIDLLPQRWRELQRMRARIPVLQFSVLALAAVVVAAAVGQFLHAQRQQATMEREMEIAVPLRREATRLQMKVRELETVENETLSLQRFSEGRSRWVMFLAKLEQQLSSVGDVALEQLQTVSEKEKFHEALRLAGTLRAREPLTPEAIQVLGTQLLGALQSTTGVAEILEEKIERANAVTLRFELMLRTDWRAR